MSSVTLHCIRTGLRIAPFFLLAGCWEKIEYKGPTTPRSDSAKSKQAANVEPSPARAEAPATIQASATEDAVVSRKNEAAAISPPAPVAAAESPPEVTSTPPPSDAPKSVGDRYAITRPATTEPPIEPSSTTRHTDATAVSATADVQPAQPLTKSRRMAWLLGSRLSLATLAHDRGAAAKSVPKWFADAGEAAKGLGTSIADLPEAGSPNEPAGASRQAIDYLISQGQTIGRHISDHQGAEPAALFEVALKSNILLLLYSPGTSAGNSIAAAITRAAPQGKLPESLWKPVVDSIARQAPANEVRAGVKKMHADVDAYLVSAAEPKGQ